jgi:cell division protein FtsB
MVLNPQAAAVRLSIDQRLAQLEAKLDRQVEENRACFAKMEKLEELLERVVKAVTQAA